MKLQYKEPMDNHHNHRESNIKTVIFLNVAFTIIEVIGGLYTNSLAILSDALHDFGDSLALITAWLGERLSQKPADQRKTYGYKRYSLLSAIFSATVLVTGSLFILSKTIPRIINPVHVDSLGMMGLAILGVLFNGLAFFRLKKGQSLNEKVLSWHLLEDVLGWVAIFIGSIIIQFWDNHYIDPIMTIGFTAFILWGVFKNLREAFNIILQGVPSVVDIESLKIGLLSIAGVDGVHDLHVWSLDGEINLLTAHVVIEKYEEPIINTTRKQIEKVIQKHKIQHSTIEFENKSYCSNNHDCTINQK